MVWSSMPITKLIRFVKSVKEAKTLFVTWYGGEALLAFDRIKSITESFKKLKLNYSAALITNGYLLDETKIRELENLKDKKIIISFGISTYTKSFAQECISQNAVNCIQLSYNVLDSHMRSVIYHANQKGIGIVVRSIFLKGGMPDHRHLMV